uniref:Somatostatin/Cortistatin C-terminal domain-containing protein n=1 Tax=Erpetoichthys calabaricus TaxID=27687 RepID=A0A8C4RX12_ERPCA
CVSCGGLAPCPGLVPACALCWLGLAPADPLICYDCFLLQALTRFTLEDIISQLGQSESELTESEVPADNEVHLDLERSTESETNQLPPRERKAGCKNFYWKTFTSC